MAFRTGTPIDPRLAAIDFEPLVKASAIQEQANVQLANAVSQASIDYLDRQKEKQEESVNVKAIKELLQVDEGQAKAILKNKAVQAIYQEKVKADSDVEIARLEASSAGDPSLQLDLESPGQFLLPPTEEFPAGRVVFGGFAKDGNLGGRAVYSPGAGEPFVVMPTGSRKYASGATDKIRGEIFDIRDALKGEQAAITALKKYYETRADTPTGIDFLIEEVRGRLSTALKQPLTKEQMLTQIGRGQFQGLLGGIRLEVLGGSVLTEQDARRLEQALSRYGVTSDPAVVKELVSDLIRSKQVTESELINRYSQTLKMDPFVFKSFGGTEPKPVEIGDLLERSSNSPKLPTLEEAEAQAKAKGLKVFMYQGEPHKVD